MSQLQPPAPDGTVFEAPPSPYQLSQQAAGVPPTSPADVVDATFLPPAAEPAPIWAPAPAPPSIREAFSPAQLRAAADAAEALEVAQEAVRQRDAEALPLIVEQPAKVNLMLRLWQNPGSWVDIDIPDTDGLRCPPGWFEVADGHAIRIDAWTRMELVETDL